MYHMVIESTGEYIVYDERAYNNIPCTELASR